MLSGPNIPSWINKVNFITNYFWNGCEAPFQLFCEFAKEPSGQAIALIIGLDVDDIVKTFFRPAGLRSHRHGRKGPRGRKKIPDLPDVNEEIGKRIPGQQAIAGRPFGSPTRWVFEFSDVADRVAFNIAIIDVVSDTVYKGLLGIIEANQSKCWWMRRGASHGEWIMNIQGHDYYRGLEFGPPVYEKGVEMNATSLVPGHGGYFMVAIEATFYQGGPTSSRQHIMLRNASTGEELDRSDEIELEAGDTGVLSLYANIPGGTVVSAWIHKEGNQLWTRSIDARCIQFSQ